MEPPGDPASTNTAMPTLQDLAARLESGATADLNRPGFTGPSSAAFSNGMPTLNDVMALMPAGSTHAAGPANVRAGKVFWSLDTNAWGVATGTAPVQVVTPETRELQPGFYDETIWSEVETNLVPENIRQEVVLFGVAGTAVFAAPTGTAPVARTGWTNSFNDFDDGYFRAGAPWPVPRFEESSDVVTDRLTGLVWLRAPPTNLFSRAQAVNFIKTNNTLKSWGATNDWRVPNVREIMSLLDFSRSNPALPDGHPFRLPNAEGDTGPFGTYLTETDYLSNRYYYLFLNEGRISSGSALGALRFVWPVRGGN